MRGVLVAEGIVMQFGRDVMCVALALVIAGVAMPLYLKAVIWWFGMVGL